MYYRIGEITFCSALEMPSYEAFACAPAEPDVTMEIGGKAPRDGKDVETGFFVCRKTADGWFYHESDQDEYGLVVSGDYTRLRLIRRRVSNPIPCARASTYPGASIRRGSGCCRCWPGHRDRSRIR